MLLDGSESDLLSELPSIVSIQVHSRPPAIRKLDPTFQQGSPHGFNCLWPDVPASLELDDRLLGKAGRFGKLNLRHPEQLARGGDLLTDDMHFYC